MNKANYRLQLRHTTHDYHVILNRHPLLKDLTKPFYPLTHYKILLRAYFFLYSSIEEVIGTFLLSNNLDFDYAERIKLPKLIKDLCYFQQDYLKCDLSDISRLTIANIDNSSDLVGLLYVIEGSTLGGQIISRALSDFHGMSEESGACFFNGYGEQSLMRWESFLQFFDSVIQDNDNFQNAKDTACRTFQTFQSALDYCIPLL